VTNVLIPCTDAPATVVGWEGGGSGQPTQHDDKRLTMPFSECEYEYHTYEREAAGTYNLARLNPPGWNKVVGTYTEATPGLPLGVAARPACPTRP
jgi:hypothetical protein